MKTYRKLNDSISETLRDIAGNMKRLDRVVIPGSIYEVETVSDNLCKVKGWIIYESNLSPTIITMVEDEDV